MTIHVPSPPPEAHHPRRQIENRTRTTPRTSGRQRGHHASLSGRGDPNGDGSEPSQVTGRALTPTRLSRVAAFRPHNAILRDQGLFLAAEGGGGGAPPARPHTGSKPPRAVAACAGGEQGQEADHSLTDRSGQRCHCRHLVSAVSGSRRRAGWSKRMMLLLSSSWAVGPGEGTASHGTLLPLLLQRTFHC